MAAPKRPTPEDRVAAIRISLAGIASGDDLGKVLWHLEPLHPRNNTFPAEVLLELAADAIEDAGASRERPIEFENIRKRYLPECSAHTKAQHHKSEYAIRAAAMIRAGVDPDLLGEISWWQTDDLWTWALDALVIYVRVAADRTGDPVRIVCERVAARHDVDLGAGSRRPGAVVGGAGLRSVARHDARTEDQHGNSRHVEGTPLLVSLWL